MTVAPAPHRLSVFPRITQGVFFASLLYQSRSARRHIRSPEKTRHSNAPKATTRSRNINSLTEDLAKFIAAYPKSDRLEDAQLLLAESNYQLKRLRHRRERIRRVPHPLSPNPRGGRTRSSAP